MAVAEQTPYIEYTANGATTSFALGFDCESKDHLIVLIDDIEPPIATWSLTGGNVVFTTAPAAGKKITLQRNTPFSRTTDYQSYNNSFRPPAVNKDFDWIWLKLQELGVMDWILGNRIDDLKNYVDDKDDELRAYLLEEIRKQGVALDQLEDYYNYLMQRLAEIAVNAGWEASFVVDASGKTQQEINDFAKSLRNFNVKDYITAGMTNHTQAFSSCVAACVAAGGGKIVIPNFDYIVGEQTKGNGVTGSAFFYAPIVQINAPNLDFVIEIQGANIKFADGLYFGGWDVSVDPPQPHDAIIVAGSSTAPIQKYYSPVGIMFEFVAANSITVIGSGVLDGNMDNVNLGGEWGDTGYQCWGNAFKITNVKTLVFDAAIEAKNFPLDGMYVGVPNSVADSSFSINGFNTHSNARQGLSLTGGRNGKFTNSKFNNMGNGVFSSLPKTGVDIEAEVGEVRNIVFEACEIKDNARAGVDDSAEINPINGVEFKNCTLQSLNNSAPSIIARRSKFKGCHLFGIAKIAERTKSQDIPVFEGNYFFDKSTGDEVSQIINYGGAANANAIFRDNNFYLSRKNAWFYPYGSGKWTFTGNKFYLMPTIPNSLTQITLDNETGNEIEFMGNELIDLRTDAAAPTITIWYPLYRKFTGNKITSTQNKMQFRWDSGTQSFNNVPRLDEARGVLTLAKNRIGSTSSLSQTATITFEAAMPTSTVLAPNNFLNYFSQGSMVLNSNAASTGTRFWQCISSGYPCANAWAASTAYSVSAGNSGYVFANNKVYKCKVAGTSSSTAPNHSSGDATDGTVTWTYIGTLATFVSV